MAAAMAGAGKFIPHRLSGARELRSNTRYLGSSPFFSTG